MNSPETTVMLKEVYSIKPVSYQVAMNMVVRYHYLHRKTSCEQAFGLFRAGEYNPCGVVVYGTPFSAPLRKGICGSEEQDNVIELTRLWICDSVGKNAESYLIGNTLRLLKKEIVLSFADTAQQHIGTIYQATNWLYTGLSAKRTSWKVAGLASHGQTLADKYTAAALRELAGDRFTLEERTRKHRYVFFNASKTRKRQLLKLLNYPVLSYPKKDDLSIIPKEKNLIGSDPQLILSF